MIKGAVAVAALYTLVHIAISGVWQPLRHDNVGQVIEELQPLYRLFTSGTASVDHPRQYGPIFLFVFHPVYRFTLARPDWLAWYAYALDLIAIAIAFIATRRAILFWLASRGVTPSRWLTPALVFLWANFSPLYGVLAIKNVELWELALIAVGGAAWLEGRRWTTAWPIAAAALVKMLPLVYVPYLVLRDRRAFAFSLVAMAALLTASQLLYGWQMGWGYLPMILSAATGGEGYGNAAGMIWHENVSIRGIAFKMFGYLETPDPTIVKGYPLGYYVVVPPQWRTVATIVAWTAQAAAILWLAIRVLRPSTQPRTDRLYWEWALVAIMMLLLAPQISHDYMILTLGAFSYVMAGCFVRRQRSLWVAFVIAVLLVGNVVPRGLFGRIVLADRLAPLIGGDHLLVAEAYQYFGFPLIGLIVLLMVWSKVSRTPAAVDGDSDFAGPERRHPPADGETRRQPG